MTSPFRPASCMRGEVRIAIERVDALDPEPSGKYPRVRQRLELDSTAWFDE